MTLAKLDRIDIKRLAAWAGADERTARKWVEKGAPSVRPTMNARLCRAAQELGYARPQTDSQAAQ